MRGWEYVGQIGSIDHSTGVLHLLTKEVTVGSGDVIALSYRAGGELREGNMRVASMSGFVITTRCIPRRAVPALCDWDHVYVARALGEHAFTRVK